MCFTPPPKKKKKNMLHVYISSEYPGITYQYQGLVSLWSLHTVHSTHWELPGVFLWKKKCVSHTTKLVKLLFFIFKFVYFKQRLNSNLGKFFGNIMVTFKGQCHEFFYEIRNAYHIQRNLWNFPFLIFKFVYFKLRINSNLGIFLRMLWSP